ncbi:MAG: aminodeoxychorismate synthase component I [Chloroflexi bacterium]|nr:aminodeoxychorismate synthase component I [Chloroflexota bacterium]
MSSQSRYPLIEEVETGLSPSAVFSVFKDEQHVFFLDSGMDHEKLGRYSFIGSDPFLILKIVGSAVHLTDSNGTTCRNDNPFHVIDELLHTYRLSVSQSPVPFIGGAVGYLSYDLCHFIERLPRKAIDDLQLPGGYLGFYDIIIAFDNLLNKAYIISSGFPEVDDELRLCRARHRLDEIKRKLHQARTVQTDSSEITGALPVTPVSNFTAHGYAEVVERARQYIISGDIFEVNLSQRFESVLACSPYELYRRLRSINPAPFACYLGFGEIKILSASPERFLRTRGDLIETRPIKGTRPRGSTAIQDELLAKELLTSTKDKAEHVMIVDLERNDLGRVCEYGTVCVSELAILETYPTVFHLTSTIQGRLKKGTNLAGILRATFPGGSITGAPKIRAMEIIDELEPVKRGIYTGSIGYLGFNGDIDLNIAIRTFLVKRDRVYFQVGGAVVYDSDPDAEFQETMDKARALITALSNAGD